MELTDEMIAQANQRGDREEHPHARQRGRLRPYLGHLFVPKSNPNIFFIFSLFRKQLLIAIKL